jgi:molybdate transport system permease protein
MSLDGLWAPLRPEEWLALRTSLEVASLALLGGLPLAVVLALALSRGSLPGRSVLDALTQAPIVLSPVALGLVLLIVFGAQGPAGAVLERAFHLRLVFTTAGAALAAGTGALPLMVRSVRLALDQADPRLEAAAATLGAGPLDRLFTVTLPLAWPGLLSAAVVGFAACLGEFGAVITFAGDVPGRTETLPLAIYAALESPGGEVHAARLAALSLLIALGAVTAAAVLDRCRRRF